MYRDIKVDLDTNVVIKKIADGGLVVACTGITFMDMSSNLCNSLSYRWKNILKKKYRMVVATGYLPNLRWLPIA